MNNFFTNVNYKELFVYTGLTIYFPREAKKSLTISLVASITENSSDAILIGSKTIYANEIPFSRNIKREKKVKEQTLYTGLNVSVESVYCHKTLLA